MLAKSPSSFLRRNKPCSGLTFAEGLKTEADTVRMAVDLSLKLNVCTIDINKDNHYSTERVGDFLESVISDTENHIVNKENLSLGQTTII